MYTQDELAYHSPDAVNLDLSLAALELGDVDWPVYPKDLPVLTSPAHTLQVLFTMPGFVFLNMLSGD